MRPTDRSDRFTPRPKTLAPSLLLLTCLLVTVPVARAVDGVLEINQACVADGCFPGDQPGFPVEISESGSYRLTSNLEVPDENTTAISTGSGADVQIDLNGFRIAGPTVCDRIQETCSPTATGNSGFGIIAASSETVIRNGTITGMGNHGVEGVGHVHSLHVSHNGGAGILSPASRIHDCEVRLNGLSGISGVLMHISGNIVKDNLGDGIRCGSGGPSVVVENTVVRNGKFGLAGECSYTDNALAGNNSGSSQGQVEATAVEMGTNTCGTDTNCP